MACVRTAATIHRPLQLVVGYRRWSTGAVKSSSDFHREAGGSGEALDRRQAQGGFGGTFERAADAADPTCPEEEEGGFRKRLRRSGNYFLCGQNGAIRVRTVPGDDLGFTRN